MAALLHPLLCTCAAQLHVNLFDCQAGAVPYKHDSAPHPIFGIFEGQLTYVVKTFQAMWEHVKPLNHILGQEREVELQETLRKARLNQGNLRGDPPVRTPRNAGESVDRLITDGPLEATNRILWQRQVTYANNAATSEPAPLPGCWDLLLRWFFTSELIHQDSDG